MMQCSLLALVTLVLRISPPDQTIKLLLRRGSILDAKNFEGWTPLHRYGRRYDSGAGHSMAIGQGMISWHGAGPWHCCSC